MFHFGNISPRSGFALQFSVLALMALTSCLASAQQTLFSSFGPGESYKDLIGLPIGGGVNWLLSGDNGALAAAAFVPPTSSPFLRADMAMLYGDGFGHSSGLPNMDIFLAADSNGFPGSTIETFHLTNVFEGMFSPGIVSINSALHPVLHGGTQYWFVVGAPDLLHTQFSWVLGPAVAPNTFTVNQLFTTVTSLSIGWGTITFNESNRPALAVYGGNGPQVGPPVIAQNGIVNAASFGSPGNVCPGAWLSVFGSNFTTVSRAWQSSDFGADGSLPTSLEGVSVLLNGKAAAISYISPNQLNVQIPDPETRQYPFEIQVVNTAGPSPPVAVTVFDVNPALFTTTLGGTSYAAATFPDGSSVSPSHPARPGDAVSVYGTGFGPSTPPIPSGIVVQNPQPLSAVSVTVGGVPAQVLYSGITEAGLDQVNIVIPEVASGDQSLTVLVQNSFTTQNGVALSIASR